MLAGRLFRARVLSVVIAVVGFASANEDVCENGVGEATDEKCGLYLAKSTIPNAGLGIFTTKPLEPGAIVGNGDIAIPIIDLAFHRDAHGLFNVFDDYVWQGWALGMHFQSNDEDNNAVTSFAPGMDAAINCNLALINTGKAVPQYDLAGLHRSRDPGAGAISPYHNGTTIITHSIPAGGELFKFYGDDWFEGRVREFGRVPMMHEYILADELLQKFGQLDLSRNGKEALWKIVNSFPWVDRKGLPWEGVMIALPDKPEDAIQASEEGIRSLYQPSATRSIEELEEFGRCMDSIRPGPSTIEGAGRGAFATRLFPKGSIITGSPLMHIPYRDFVDMYDVHVDEYNMDQRGDSIVGAQILKNYCFGHRDSTLLLCPYGAGVNYINHDAARANVKIQWTPDGISSHNDSWFDKTVRQMEWNYKISLSFDFVATRDILPEEELFMDYGTEWQDAWEEHVKNWEPPAGSEDYEPAVVWNARLKGKMLRTQSEQEIEPYPSHLDLLCHSEIEDSYKDWTEDFPLEERGILCNIVDRRILNGEFVYDIELPDETVNGKPKRVENIPRGAFHFADKPYSTDNHLPNAFRHELMIPDDMFPEKWKNIILGD